VKHNIYIILSERYPREKEFEEKDNPLGAHPLHNRITGPRSCMAYRIMLYKSENYKKDYY